MNIKLNTGLNEQTIMRKILKKSEAIYKKHRLRAIPNRLASGSARGQNMQKRTIKLWKTNPLLNIRHRPNKQTVQILPTIFTQKVAKNTKKYKNSKKTQKNTLKNPCFSSLFPLFSLLFLLLLRAFLHFLSFFQTFGPTYT